MSTGMWCTLDSMFSAMKFLARTAAVMLALLAHSTLAADSSDALEVTPQLANYYELIYQIRVVARKAGSKSSIGSGFQVSPEGLIVTNFHVVAGAVNSPDSHRIEYLDQSGNSGELVLLDFDVVHDLALLRHPTPAERHFQVETGEVSKGAMLYALGNPHDLGVTLKQGAFNGYVEHSFDQQILFSGSLNPGMSGGPSLLADGRVVGVNVATAGSDLSFLVPATAVARLIEANRALASNEYSADITRQLLAWQKNRYDDLLARDWQRVDFAGWSALGELRNDMQCWGRSNEDDDEITVVSVSKGCDAANRLYLGDSFSSGHIHYSFSMEQAVDLSTLRFHSTRNLNMYPDNSGDDTQLTSMDCHSQFLTVESADDAENQIQASLCTRAYIEMPGLFDVLLLATQREDDRIYTAHFALAGVSRKLADAFTRKFLTTLGWR